MSTANPRRCVEQALPPRLLHRWLTACIAAQHAAYLAGRTAEPVPASDHALRDALDRAWRAPLAALEPKARAAAERRLDRLQAAALAPHRDAVLVKVFLAVAYLWRDLLEDGHCVLVAGSDAARAYDAILDHVLAEAGDVVNAADRSGEKAARRLRQWLEGQGYYRDRGRVA